MRSSRLSGSGGATADASDASDASDACAVDLDRQFADSLVPPPPFWADWLDQDPWEDPPDGARDAQFPPAGLLSDLDPGPLLTAMIGDADLGDRTACPDELVVEIAAAAARLQAWAASVELAATAALTDRALDWPGVATTPDKHHVCAEQMSAAELGCALNRSPAAAMHRVALAEDLRRLPATRAALGAGAIDLNTARMTVDVLRPLGDADAAAVEATVIGPEQGRVRDGNGRVHSQLRQALRRAAIRVNPTAYETQERAAFETRRMEHYPLGDTNPGMAGLAFTHREDVIAQASDYIRALAKAAIAADTPGQARTLDQACADVLADLCTGRTLRTAGTGTGTGSGPSVHVVVGATTLLDQDDEPGWLAGHGPISAQTARRIAADPTGTWRRLLTDPATGGLLDYGTTVYEPPKNLTDHIITRDQTCRGLGCRIRAERCDLDHTLRFPDGPTADHNLTCECRRCHIRKHQAGWKLQLLPNGDVIWTSPTGHRYHDPVPAVLDDCLEPRAPDHDPPPF